MFRPQKFIALKCLLILHVMVFSFGTGMRPYQDNHCLADEQSDTIQVRDCSTEPLHSARVASDRPGVLEIMLVEEGDTVEQGELVAQLRDDATQAAVDSARKETENDIEIRLADKTSEVAEAEYEQAKQANANPNLQVVTRYELRRLQLSAEQTKLQIEQAEHDFALKKLQLIEAEERLREHKIFSPISGLVVRRFRSQGEAVQQGGEIVEVVDFSTIKVEGFVKIADSWAIQPGDDVVVRLEGENLSSRVRELTFRGKLRFVDQRVTPITEEIRVWAEVKNTNFELKPGLRASMEIKPAPQKSASNH